SDFLVSVGLGSGPPLPSALPWCAHCSCPPSRGRACTTLLGGCSPGPRYPGFSTEREDLPDVWTVLFLGAATKYPAQRAPPGSDSLAVTLCAVVFRADDPLDAGFRSFRGCTSRLLRSLVYASPASLPSPSQDSLPVWRASLHRAGFAPAGRFL